LFLFQHATPPILKKQPYFDIIPSKWTGKRKLYPVLLLRGGIFMGKTKKTYSVEFKLAAVEMYLNEDMGYKRVAAELGIHFTMVKRWVYNDPKRLQT
jgi:hypothetical protein